MSRLSGLGLSATAEALVTLCRQGVPSPALVAMPGFREMEFQSALATLAQRHGVFGLVLLALQKSALLAELPLEVAESYAGSLRLLRRQAALWDLERDFVVSALIGGGIPVVLLKGAALRVTAYEDSVQRPFGDLDVLVPEDSVDATVTLLMERGYHSDTEHRIRLYREHHHHLVLKKELGFIVEVHWALQPARSQFLLDPVAFRRGAVPRVTRSGQPVRVPAVEHNVLHLAAQNVEDSFSRLGRIVDIDRLIRSDPESFDWQRLCADAIRMRVNGGVALSLRIAELLFETPIPVGFSQRLQLSRMTRAHLAMFDPIGLLLEQQGTRRRAILEHLLLLWSIPDRPTRLKTLVAMQRGEHDWFVKFLPAGEASKRTASQPRIPVIKLALYQLWLYCSAAASLVRGPRRVRRFWSWRAAATRPADARVQA